MIISHFRRWYKELTPDERLLVSYPVIGSVAALIVTLIVYGTSEPLGPFWIHLLFTVALLGVNIVFYRTGNKRLVTGLQLFVAFVWITFSLLDKPHIGNNFLYWFGVLPLGGGLLLGLTGMFFGMYLSLVALVGFVTNTFVSYELTEVVNGGEHLVLRVSCYLAFFLLVGALTRQFIKTNNQVIQIQTTKLNTLLRIVTHDISNPLTLIRGVSDLLAKNPDLDDRALKQVRKIYDASDSIYLILERVRHIQALKAGKIVLRSSPMSLLRAWQQTVALFEHRLKDKQLQIDNRLGDRDFEVLVEPVVFVHEVLCNLLSNAIKFSSTGKWITFDAYEQGEWVVVLIQDQGVGIPAPFVKVLFDEFKETSRHGTCGEVGTGFGMPLVKNLVEAFGGRIEVESRTAEESPESHGTIFRVYLPRKPRRDDLSKYELA